MTTGGNKPSNRSPVSGSSAETRGPAGMDLGADVMSDQAHDPFAVGRRHVLARVGKSSRETVYPEPPHRG